MLSFQRILAGTAAAAVIALVACASSLQSIAPFPCAEDGTCPDGFGCGQDDSKCYACSNGVTSGQACSGTCTDLTTSSDCGSCGNVCMGQTTCLFGSCGCATGTACGGSCADLATDADNCGACGTTCKGAETCISSKCACTSGTFCSATSTCADLGTDSSNCGKCGNACPGTETCESGQCGCPPGDVVCGSDTCSDLQTDGSNCGMCGMACPATQVCAAGQCGCPPQTQICPSESPTACVNFTSDSNNCDGCGNVCPTGMTCMESACMCAPPPGGGVCDVFPECGCTPGTQCARDNGAPEACVAVGPTPTGGSCTTSANCQQGSVCSGNGICVALCDPKTAPCPANYNCLEQTDSTGTSEGFSVCYAHCDPLQPFATTAVDTACETGQSCIADASVTGGSFCESLTTPGQVGAACENYTYCAPELLCVYFDGTSSMSGTCETLCLVGSNCPNGGTCFPFTTAIMVDNQNLGYCGTSCIPTEPESFCGAGHNCAYTDATGGEVGTVCESILTSGAAGATCVNVDDCAVGYNCVNFTVGGPKCAAWCTVGSECPTGGLCTAYSPPLTIGGVQYGSCPIGG